MENWPNRTRTIGDEFNERRITLWFTDCPHTPETIVIHVQLGGRVYEDMLHKADIRPSGNTHKGIGPILSRLPLSPEGPAENPTDICL